MNYLTPMLLDTEHLVDERVCGACEAITWPEIERHWWHGGEYTDHWTCPECGHENEREGYL